MKKLLTILLLFISAHTFGQLTPVSPVATPTMTWYRDNGGRTWVYKGSALGWFQMTDTLEVTRMIAAAVPSTLTFSNGLTKTINNVALGGALTGNTVITGTTQSLAFQFGDASSTTVSSFSKTGAGFTAFNSSFKGGTISVNTDSTLLMFSHNGTVKSSIRLSDNDITIRDGIHSKWMVYAADYSANSTSDNRSIPDYGGVKALLNGYALKTYVDSLNAAIYANAHTAAGFWTFNNGINVAPNAFYAINATGDIITSASINAAGGNVSGRFNITSGGYLLFEPATASDQFSLGNVARGFAFKYPSDLSNTFNWIYQFDNTTGDWNTSNSGLGLNYRALSTRDLTGSGGVASSYSQKVFVTPDQYGAVGNGTTDDYTAFVSAIASGYDVRLTPGKTYRISATLTLNTGQSLFGQRSSFIKFAGIKAFIPGNNSTFDGVNFLGNKHNSSSTSEFAIWNRAKNNVKITNCRADSVATVAFYVDSTAGAAGLRYTNTISGSHGENNTVFIKTGQRGEYLQNIGNTSRGCDTAVIRMGGNNPITGGEYISGTVGLYDGSDGINEGHSTVTGAIFNHNTTNLLISGVRSIVGNVYSNNNFENGSIRITNSGNISILGGNMTFISIDTLKNTNSTISLTNVNIGASPHYTEVSGGTHTFKNNHLIYASPTTADQVLYQSDAILASSDFLNQGTATTVLHGNASGNPSFGAVSLTADVSGITPIANGGTGSATQNFVDLTSNQTNIAGGKTFQNATNNVVTVQQNATSPASGNYAFRINNTAQNSNTTAAGAFSIDVNSGRALTVNGMGNMLVGKNLVLTAIAAGVAGTDSLLVKNSSTNVTTKISPAFYAPTTGATLITVKPASTFQTPAGAGTDSVVVKNAATGKLSAVKTLGVSQIDTANIATHTYTGRYATINGSPTFVTQTQADNSTKAATTAYVDRPLIDNVLSKAANYTIVSGDFVAGKKATLDLYVDATAGNVTITLPSASTFKGYTIYVTKTDVGVNIVTVNTVSGLNTLVSQYQERQFNSDGTNWYNH